MTVVSSSNAAEELTDGYIRTFYADGDIDIIFEIQAVNSAGFKSEPVRLTHGTSQLRKLAILYSDTHTIGQ